MATAVTEIFPGAQPSIDQKSDTQSVPAGQEDRWWSAADSNEVGQFDVVLSRMSRLQAMVAATVAGGNNGKAGRFTGIDGSSGLGSADSSFSTDLNKTWAAFVEKIEQGGDLDGTASGNNLMGVYNGIVSGTFTAGALYDLSSDGSFIPHVSGAHPPIARGLTATTAYVDIGGRVRADNVGIEFNISGALKFKSGAALTLGNTDINGTLTVSGGTTLSGSLTVAGSATFSGSVTMESGLTVQGAIEADTSYKMGGNVIIDSSGNITAVNTDLTGVLTINNVAGGTGQFVIGGERKLAGEFIGQYTMRGHNDADADTSYAQLLAKIVDPSAGSEEGQYEIFTIQAGALVQSAQFNQDGLTLAHNNGVLSGDGTAADQDLHTVDEGSVDASRPRVKWQEADDVFFMTKGLFVTDIGCVTGDTADFQLFEEDATVDEGRWSFLANNDNLQLRARNDADGAGNTVFQITRSGTNITTFSFNNGRVNISDNFSRAPQIGVVADGTQTQGPATQLTKDIVEIGTVAIANDAVKLTSAVAGFSVFIINNGANTVQIFPSSGDDIDGNGVNVAITLAAGASIKLYAIDATNWHS